MIAKHHRQSARASLPWGHSQPQRTSTSAAALFVLLLCASTSVEAGSFRLGRWELAAPDGWQPMEGGVGWKALSQQCFIVVGKGSTNADPRAGVAEVWKLLRTKNKWPSVNVTYRPARAKYKLAVADYRGPDVGFSKGLSLANFSEGSESLSVTGVGDAGECDVAFSKVLDSVKRVSSTANLNATMANQLTMQQQSIMVQQQQLRLIQSMRTSGY